jgi:hypothetical protein
MVDVGFYGRGISAQLLSGNHGGLLGLLNCSAPNYFVGLASERFVGERPFGQSLSWVVDREVAERRF